MNLCGRCYDSSTGRTKTASVSQCDVCLIYLCKKCTAVHDKYYECFIEKQGKPCYICHNKEAWYDYGVKQFICSDCW